MAKKDPNLKAAGPAYLAQYRKQLAKLEIKLVNLKESLEAGHSELAKGWLKELAQEANSMRRDIEREI